MDKDRQPYPIRVVSFTYNRAHVACNAVNLVLEQEIPAELYELLIVGNASANDVDKLLEIWSYNIGRVRIKLLDYLDRVIQGMMRFVGPFSAFIRNYWQILIIRAIFSVFKSLKNV